MARRIWSLSQPVAASVSLRGPGHGNVEAWNRERRGKIRSAYNSENMRATIGKVRLNEHPDEGRALAALMAIEARKKRRGYHVKSDTMSDLTPTRRLLRPLGVDRAGGGPRRSSRRALRASWPVPTVDRAGSGGPPRPRCTRTGRLKRRGRRAVLLWSARDLILRGNSHLGAVIAACASVNSSGGPLALGQSMTRWRSA